MNNNRLDQFEEMYSERQIAARAGLSRTTLRSLKNENSNPTLKSLFRVAQVRGQSVHIVYCPENSDARFDCSTSVVADRVVRDGFNSWKIHFFNLVDECRRSRDGRLTICPPIPELDEKLQALLASIVIAVHQESKESVPLWALKQRPLSSPWFPSEIESLKAAALMESPLAFRMKNIFVLENFMRRV